MNSTAENSLQAASKMHFKIHNEVFLKALSKMHALLEPEARITLAVEEGLLRVIAYDQRCIITSIIPIINGLNGTTSTGLKLLHDLIKSSDGFWEIAETNVLALKYASGSYSLPLILEPLILEPLMLTSTNYISSWSISGGAFAKLIRCTSVASGTTHYQGTNLHYRNNILRAICTDGLRLSCMESAVNSASTKETRINLSRDLLSIVSKWPDDTLLIETNGLQVELSWHSQEISYRVRLNAIPNTLPDNYEDLTRAVGQIITLSGKVLISALHRTALFTSDQTRRVILEPSPTSLTIKSSNLNTGSGTETIAAQCSENARRLCINAKMLTDLPLDGTITLQGGVGGPVSVRMTDHPDWTYIFMPIAVTVQ